MKLLNYSLALIYFSILLPMHASSQGQETDYLSQDMRRTQITAGIATIVGSLYGVLKGGGAFSSYSDASGKSTAFVEEIASEHGITDEIQVKIGEGYAAGIGTIMVPYEPNYYFLRATLDTALEKLEYGNDKEVLEALEELDEHIGSLDHEFTHYKNHDMRNSLLVTSLVNLCIYSAYFTFEYKMLSEKLRNSSTLKKWLYTHFSTLGLSATTGLLSCWYSRIREARADEGVRNEAPILKAMINFFKKEEQMVKDLLSNSNWFNKKFAGWLEKYPCLYLRFDPLHPPIPERIARFQERLDALELASV
ncbi:hypothetical protein BH09DEP1_BH09DEP1_3970 [soil metagenome]